MAVVTKEFDYEAALKEATASSKPFSIKEKIRELKKDSSTKDFYEYLEQLKKDVRDQNSKENRYDSLLFKALIGEKEAVSFFLSAINQYLTRNPFSGTLPAAYNDAAEAVFHEWIGFGPAYKWFLDKKYTNSPGMQIIGRSIFINEDGKGYKLYEHKMASFEQVERLKRVLLSNDTYMQVDHHNPAGELKMDDPLWPDKHIRLAIWIEPRVWNEFITITARRQVSGYLSFNDQAVTGSIPKEAVPMLKALVKTYLRTVVAGQVGSGKSTFANTIVGEQLSMADRCMGVVMIEKHPESTIPYVFRDKHRIIPVVAGNDEVTDVGIESLRHDPDIVYLTEMRYYEWGLFLFSSEKGHKGLIGTYHTDDPEEIPYQGAMAYYSKEGGSLKAHIITASKACELTLIMRGLPNGQKRLERVSEIIYDPVENSVKSNDLMRWDEETDSWKYNDKVSAETLYKMRRVDKQAAEDFMRELSALAASAGEIKDPVKVSFRAMKELRS